MEKTAAISSCYHCGDTFQEEVVHFDGKLFCCNGCRSVFEILNSHQLNEYYKISETPGIKATFHTDKYKFLDIEEISSKLLDFKEDELRVFRIYLPDIHCTSCIWLLENLHKLNSEIVSSQVNFLKKEALISFNTDKVSFREVAELLDKIGYAPQFDLQKKEEKTNKKLYLKLGLTFFCFGNIMLFSFPEYLNPDDIFLKNYRGFFSLLVLLFSLPLIFYSAQGYLTSAFKALWNRSINLDVPISLGILALYGKSTYDILSGSGPGYMDSFAGFILFLLIGKWFQEKTYQALSFERDYKSYFPMAVTQVIKNKEIVKPVEQIEKGDILIIKNEEIIPADSIIVKGEAQIDYSFVTGETTPKEKKAGDKVYAGGKQMGQLIKVKVTAELNQSYLTQLWNQSAFEKKSDNPILGLNKRLSETFIISVLAITSIAASYWWFFDRSEVINVTVSVLIVACPCALALSIPFTFGNILRLAGKNKFYLKNINTIERLAKVTDIVFDKTGTLTIQNHSNINFVGYELTQHNIDIIFSIVRNSTHPLSRLITEHLKGYVQQTLGVQGYKETKGKGVYGKVKEKEIYIGSRTWVKAKGDNPSLSSYIYVRVNNDILGYFKVENKFRPNFGETIQNLKHRYQLHVLSGDNESEKTNLMAHFPWEKQLLFNQQPIDKLNYIKGLQESGANVMMIGDGLNDAGALKQSDTGIVLAENVYNFTPACDAIIDASQFDKIPKFIKLSQYGLTVLKISYVVSLLYNVTGLFFAITNQLSPIIAAIIMPLSSISVVLITTFLIRLYGDRILNKSPNKK